MENEKQLNTNPLPLSDFDRATGLSRGTAGDFATLRDELCPHMDDLTLRFCRAYFSHRKRIPYRGELGLWDPVVAARRKECEGMQVASLRCEDCYIAETFEDLLSKLRVLEPSRIDPPTLAQCAEVSQRYLRMVGRSTPYRFSASEQRNDEVTPTYAAYVLLCPQGEEADYEAALESLLAAEELRGIPLRRIPVAPYGLLATLALHTKGLIGNPDLLPLKEGQNLFSALGDAFVGRELWNLPRDASPILCRLAKEHGLHAVYFARATDGEDFVIQNREAGAPRRMLSLSVIRELMTLPYPASPWILHKDPGVQAPASHLTEELRQVPNSSVTNASLLCVRGECDGKDTGFSSAMSLGIDLLLHLVCRGADRRAISFYTSYMLPKDVQSDEERGQALSPMLGIYRLTMELAAPQPPAHVTFQGDRIHLSCVGYASLPQRLIPDRGGMTGDRLYYLPVWEGGFPDFQGVRGTLDRWGELVKGGQVRCACPVLGDLSSATRSLVGQRRIEPVDNPVSSPGDRGILFASACVLDLPCVGTLCDEEDSEIL